MKLLLNVKSMTYINHHIINLLSTVSKYFYQYTHSTIVHTYEVSLNQYGPCLDQYPVSRIGIIVWNYNSWSLTLNTCVVLPNYLTMIALVGAILGLFTFCEAQLQEKISADQLTDIHKQSGLDKSVAFRCGLFFPDPKNDNGLPIAPLFIFNSSWSAPECPNGGQDRFTRFCDSIVSFGLNDSKL